MKISVIMSVYSEPEVWIRQAIESILNQTYFDFEFIIINDKPYEDLNKRLLNEYSKKDNRILIINNKENLGLTKSLNIALKKAKGTYIARMDADDISLPERFQKQVEFMDANLKIVACGTRIKTFGGKFMKWKMETESIHLRNHFLLCSPLSTPLCHPAAMIRKETLDFYNIEYNESMKSAQDYDLWRRLLEVGELYNLPHYLLNYRLSEHQVSALNKKNQKNYARKVRRDYILHFFKQINVEYELPEIICLNEINELKKTLKLNKYYNKYKLEINNIITCYYLSLREFTFKSLFVYILSFDFLLVGIPLKERIRVIYNIFFNSNKTTYL